MNIKKGLPPQMKLLRNMKIGRKISMLIVIAILGMAIIGYNGFNAMVTANKDAEIMYEKNFQDMKKIGDLLIYITLAQVKIESYIIDPKSETALKVLAEAYDGYEQIWSNIANVDNPGEEQKAALSTLEESYNNFKAGIEEIKELVDAGKTDAAWERFQQLENNELETLRGHIVEMQNKCNSDADTLIDAIRNNSTANSFSIILTIILAILILSVLSFVIIRDIIKNLDLMTADFERMRDGDFTIKSEKKSERKDEFGIIYNELLETKFHLRALLRSVTEAAEHIAASSEELAASADQSAQASSQVASSAQDVVDAIGEQQAAVSESKESMERVNSASAAVKEEAQRVSAISKEAARHAADGVVSVESSVKTIRDVEVMVSESADIVNLLGKRSKEIGDIVVAISSIADQTNLLALNATIEAARAGEHGKGFAVVAEEISKLANESQLSTEKIGSLIKTIQEDTERAVSSMTSGRDAVLEGTSTVENLKEVFGQINELVSGVNGQMDAVVESINDMANEGQNIARNVTEINELSDKVAEDMENVSASTEEQSASTEEIAASSESLAGLAQEQQAALASFKF